MSGFSKSDSTRIKGVAILMMLMHHLYRVSNLFEDYSISFTPLSEASVINLASSFKICVSLFAFISGFGLFLSFHISYTHLHTPHRKFASITLQWLSTRIAKLLTPFVFIYLLSFLATLAIDGRPVEIYFSGSKIAGCIYAIIDALGLANLFGTPTLCGTWWYMSAAVIYIILVPYAYLISRRIGWFPVVAAIICIPRLLGIDFPGGQNALTFLLPMLLGMIAADTCAFDRLNQHGRTKPVHGKLTGDGTFSLPYAVLSLIAIYVSYRIYINVDNENLWEFKLGFFPVFVIIFLKYAVISVPIVSPILEFLGRHSMTMFLTHTFICGIYLENLVYSTGHFLTNYLLLLALSVILAVIIDWLKKVLRIDRIPALITNYITKVTSKAQPNES